MEPLGTSNLAATDGEGRPRAGFSLGRGAFPGDACTEGLFGRLPSTSTRSPPSTERPTSDKTRQGPAAAPRRNRREEGQGRRFLPADELPTDDRSQSTDLETMQAL